MAITFIRIMLVVSVLLLNSQLVSAAQQCSYSTWSWSVTETKAVAYRRVVKNYSDLKEYERDRLTGCSICEQDQTVTQLRGTQVVQGL